MSVESARDRVLCWDTKTAAKDASPEMVEDVDRLILEVQAEMPCEFKPDGRTCNGVQRFPYDEMPCRSCAAKVKLAQVPA